MLRRTRRGASYRMRCWWQLCVSPAAQSGLAGALSARTATKVTHSSLDTRTAGKGARAAPAAGNGARTTGAADVTCEQRGTHRFQSARGMQNQRGTVAHELPNSELRAWQLCCALPRIQRLGNAQPDEPGQSFAELAKLDANALSIKSAVSIDWDRKHKVVRRDSTAPYTWTEFRGDPEPFQIRARALFDAALDLVGAPLHPKLRTEKDACQLLVDVRARTGYAYHGPWPQGAEMAAAVTGCLASVRDDFLSAYQDHFHERFWDSCAAAALGLQRKDAAAGGGIPVLSVAQWAPLPVGTPEDHCPIEYAVQLVQEGVAAAVHALPCGDPRRFDVTLYQRAAETVLDTSLRGDAGRDFFSGAIEYQKAIVNIVGSAADTVCTNTLPRKRPRRTADGAGDDRYDQHVQVFHDMGSAGHKPRRRRWR
jgi:hypothetical protein